jgi:signal transduction histidine kinase/ligand-binding sensor domain-containing protein
VPASSVANGRSKPLSQYLREDWGSERGFPGVPINAIAQTPDGYLWLGTQKGLVRFDGRNFHLFSQSNTNGGPVGPVLGLMTDGEGNLWIRLQGATLLRYHDGKFEELTNNFKLPEIAVTQMCRAADGRAIFATILNGIVAYDHGKFSTVTAASHLPNFLVISMAPKPGGGFWLGTRDLGLFNISEGKVSAASDILQSRKVNALLSADSQKLWIGTDNGLLLWDGHALTEVGLKSSLHNRQILSLIKDGDGNVWVGTDQGLYRLDSESDFSSKSENENFEGNGPCTTIFLDREGNIWTASARGLQRLRNTIFTTYSISDGLPAESNGPVYVDPDGRTWFAPTQGGLYWLKDGQVGRTNLASIDKDVVYSLAGGNGDLWVARQLGGLTHLRNLDGEWNAATFTKADGLGQDSVYAVRLSKDGTVWAGTLSAGLTRIKDGKFSTFTTENGLISNTIASILESADGTMWFATPRGLSSFSSNHWSSYSSADGLPSVDVNCLFQDSAGILWIGTNDGPAAFRAGKIWVPAQVSEQLHEPIFGIQQDSNGSLWISTSNHVLMINRERLLQPDFNGSDIREFDLADGLRDTDGIKRDETVASDPSGKIWFSLNRGLSVVDTNRLRINSPPSIIQLEGLYADGNHISSQNLARIPANPQRITINFNGLSLSVPDRVRFKYKLDNFDQTWSEPLIAREATYTNLNPGSYLFRVIASNSDGVWNSSELTVPFKVEPVFWRTWWFGLAALFVLVAAILGFVRLRVLSLTRQLHVRFEERLAERTRIAQELHDTLLQGLLSASMQLHVANDQLTEESPAKPLVNRVLQLMGRVIDEGRNAVRGLRSSNRESVSLEQAFSTIPQELAIKEPIDLRVIVEGTPRRLRPPIRDEIYLVGREGLVNALRHSGAREIEVEIEYAPNWLRVLVSDDGSGIDPQVLSKGRDGHWGLSGMRERAERIGAKFRVLSRISAGTEIELSVPGGIVYEPEPSGRRFKFLSLFRFRSPHVEESTKTDSQEQ